MKDQIIALLKKHSDEWDRFLVGGKDQLVLGKSALMNDLHSLLNESEQVIHERLTKYVPV